MLRDIIIVRHRLIFSQTGILLVKMYALDVYILFGYAYRYIIYVAIEVWAAFFGA